MRITQLLRADELPPEKERRIAWVNPARRSTGDRHGERATYDGVEKGGGRTQVLGPRQEPLPSLPPLPPSEVPPPITVKEQITRLLTAVRQNTSRHLPLAWCAAGLTVLHRLEQSSRVLSATEALMDPSDLTPARCEEICGSVDTRFLDNDADVLIEGIITDLRANPRHAQYVGPLLKNTGGSWPQTRLELVKQLVIVFSRR